MVEYGGKGLQSKPGAGIRGAQGCLGVRNVIVNGVEVKECVDFHMEMGLDVKIAALDGVWG